MLLLLNIQNLGQSFLHLGILTSTDDMIFTKKTFNDSDIPFNQIMYTIPCLLALLWFSLKNNSSFYFMSVSNVHVMIMFVNCKSSWPAQHLYDNWYSHEYQNSMC